MAPKLTPVSFDVVAPELPPRAPKEPEAKLAPEPQPARVLAVRPSPRSVAPANEPADRPAPVPPEAPIDLTGVTLSSGDGSWSSAVGNGQPMTGPLKTGSGAAHSARPNPPAGAPPVERIRVLRAEDLSRRPAPPALGNLLRNNYPVEARRLGLEGLARVRARIDPDGVARACTVLSATDRSFGEACRRTVEGSIWSPPVDLQGRTVSSHIQYTCRFEVQR
jgi:TonB family protein